MKKDRFDGVAFIYDALAYLVFGKSITSIQSIHFDKISLGRRILFIGGGTGKLLLEIDKRLQPSEIVYIEMSPKMMELSKKHIVSAPITYVTDSYEVAKNYGQFDLIITNFFLDVLQEKALKTFISTTPSLLNKRGLWLISDFRIARKKPLKYLHKFLHWSMITFFKVTANLQNTTLYNYVELITTNNFRIKATATTYKKMIFSVLVEKK
ncbi:class I SAM-dependent methyltransferase [Flammeovirga kamogawensis]|uniref:Methyltransferase domain-containing protein n=1 Tax=Flammeovirga kamogawensis TaxID=373891 RepID=A0ABX8GVN2_9BACT|nr:methyltransferase domain-containing protein [Flammeovirga kamogawensis]MBB6459734.1 spermidine synthase [Flammeovirga kamogawensis]QWG07207.1 methyltransferase domain-containing protein [Flammeovirga kamogawensis]